MNKPTQSVEVLEAVIENCDFEELIEVSIRIKEELDYYEMNQIKVLFKFIRNRYLYLANAVNGKKLQLQNS